MRYISNERINTSIIVVGVFTVVIGFILCLLLCFDRNDFNKEIESQQGKIEAFKNEREWNKKMIEGYKKKMELQENIIEELKEKIIKEKYDLSVADRNCNNYRQKSVESVEVVKEIKEILKEGEGEDVENSDERKALRDYKFLCCFEKLEKIYKRPGNSGFW